MKISLRTSKLIVLSTICFLIITLVFLSWMLTYRIEKTVDVVVQVSEVDSSQFEISTLQGHLFADKSNITLKVGDEYYQSRITLIKFNPDTSRLVIRMTGINERFIPGISFSAKVIVGSKPVYASLLKL